eukprot:SM000129S26140  [mRNA]  locus=s129:281260:283715:+ [translate_table: standard]
MRAAAGSSLAGDEEDDDAWEAEMLTGPLRGGAGDDAGGGGAEAAADDAYGWAALARRRALHAAQLRLGEAPAAAAPAARRRRRRKPARPVPLAAATVDDASGAAAKPERRLELAVDVGGPSEARVLELSLAAGFRNGLEDLAALRGAITGAAGATTASPGAGFPFRRSTAVDPHEERRLEEHGAQTGDCGHAKQEAFSAAQVSRGVDVTMKSHVGSSREQQGAASLKEDARPQASGGAAPVLGVKLLGRGSPEINAQLIGARSVAELLDVLADELGRRGSVCGSSISVGSRSQASFGAVNAATSLHRLARHMESEAISVSERLAVARLPVVADLLACTVELLPVSGVQGVVNSAWALSKIAGGAAYAAELRLLVAAALDHAPELKPQHIATLAAALVGARLACRPLLAGLVERAAEQAAAFQPQELSQLLWACAVLMQPATALLDQLDAACFGSASPRLFGQWSGGQLARAAWAYTVLAEARRPSFHALLLAVRSGNSRDAELHAEGNTVEQRRLSQLHQVQLGLAAEWPELELSLGGDLAASAAAAWEREKREGKRAISSCQREVARLLVGTGRLWEEEHAGGPYSLDLALPTHCIGVEVDGPSHFARDTGDALGATVLKRRQLRRLGWRLVAIPFYEWEELRGEEEMWRYLQNKLAAMAG